MSKQKKNDMLGKGIRSLLQTIDSDLKTTTGHLKDEVVAKNTGIIRIPVEDIIPNKNQPRKDFNEQALSELSASIKTHNIIQPLTVVASGHGKYKLIAGERRLRAAKIAGLKDVPVYVRELEKSDILELALLENLQRENLNAIEVALSYKRLMDDLEYTQEQVAERMGKERTTVSNYIRLLKLPPDIQVAVRNNVISMGHARSLINVDSVDKQLFIFSEIKNKELSVRQTEDLVRKLYHEVKTKPEVKQSLPAAFKKIEDSLASEYSTKVRLAHNKNGKGSIQFEYSSLEELNNLLSKLNINVS
ncbi:MAG: ParB/RepB/Spo0J family partition protein [Bacteroidetes bacterium]|nr:ParB/RepB/Spo0J family partition protein [Bacteroidota bacterium]